MAQAVKLLMSQIERLVHRKANYTQIDMFFQKIKATRERITERKKQGQSGISQLTSN